jgi:Ca2+-binding RTX toxin-like protein
MSVMAAEFEVDTVDTEALPIVSVSRAAALAAAITGTPGDDILAGTAGDDVLSGLGGNDVHDEGQGNDVFDGGDGSDVVRFEFSPLTSGTTVDLAITTPQNTGLGMDTYLNVENLAGSNFADQLYGGAGANTIGGAGGNDTIHGRLGNDELHGGAGDDTIAGDEGNDVLYGDDGDDVLYGERVENLAMFGRNTLYGGDGADVLQGGHGRDVLIGGAGNDRLSAYVTFILGNPYPEAGDTLDGGDGDDILEHWEQGATVDGGGGSDTFRFTLGAFSAPNPGRSDVTGGAGFDVLQITGAGAIDVYLDTPAPTATRAIVATGIEEVRIRTDISYVGAQIHAGAADDRMIGIDGQWHSRFSAWGGDGNDTIIGGAGSEFHGEGGNDRLAIRDRGLADGGAGVDTVAFIGALGSYSFMERGGDVYVTGTDPFQTVQAVNAEYLEFSDGTLGANDGDPLFDTFFYAKKYGGVYGWAAHDAKANFESTGWKQSWDPNNYFDTDGYLGLNRDVLVAGYNPLEHYRNNGWVERRDPAWNFDTDAYLIWNPDVDAAGINPLSHYLAHGRAEGRAISNAVGKDIAPTGFDREFYLLANPDVAHQGLDPWVHYQSAGWKQGRMPNGYFDAAGYLAAYADVRQTGIDPLWHYINFGWKEGRDPSRAFDTSAYLDANPDVKAAGYNPLLHFLSNGLMEGRRPIGDGAFDPLPREAALVIEDGALTPSALQGDWFLV